ncbi:MAG TPA: CHAT domain-containing protein [Thermoanaerobaculia bacterium]
MGGKLFRALLNDSVRRLFDRALGSLKAKTGRNLRIRIHIDPNDARLRPLLGMPWELLYCAGTRGFLNLDRHTPVVRSLDALQSTTAAPLSSPLRVLLVMANPAGTSPLNLAEERAAVERTLRRIGSVELNVLERATCKGLRHRVREENFGIVHFMGHGAFDEPSAEGTLLLETSDGLIDPIPGEVLATILKQGVGPALVVLNACKTAKSSAGEGATPFAGVAAALVGRGIPAVLAMRTSVRDSAAISLTEELYERLAAGDPVEAALSEARLALYSTSPSSPDWAIPVLFVRTAVISVHPELQRETDSPPPPQEIVERGHSQQINNNAPIGTQNNIQGNVNQGRG